MMFLATLFFLLLCCVLLCLADVRSFGYRTYSWLVKAAWLSFVVSGILFGWALSEAWL